MYQTRTGASPVDAQKEKRHLLNLILLLSTSNKRDFSQFCPCDPTLNDGSPPDLTDLPQFFKYPYLHLTTY